MKSSIEKPKKVSRKEIPEVSPKAIVDEMNKENPRKRKPRGSYGYIPPLQKLVSEKGPSEAKPRRSRRKNTEESIPEQKNLDMQPVDKQEDWNHTKKTEVKPYWKTPENIPVEPEEFEIETNEPEVFSGDHLTADEENEHLEMIDQHNLEFFGTKDQSKIAMILAEKYRNHEAELEVLPPNPDFPVDNADHYSNLSQKTSIQREERIHGNPNAYELRKPRREKNSGHDNLKTIPDYKQERASRGILGRIKNFWLELKNDTKSIAEELGWDEEAELEKQAREYQKHLKETTIKQDQDYSDLEKAA